MRQPRLRACNVRGKPMWKVDDRDEDGNGKRYFYPRTDDGKTAAKQKIDELIRAAILAEDQPLLNPLVDRDAVLGTVIERDDGTREIGGYGGEWLRHRGGKVRSRRSRQDLFVNHVIPFDLGGGRTLGSTRVRDITRGHVRLFVTTKRERGYQDETGAWHAYAPNSVRLMFRVLDAMLATAVSDGLLLRHPVDRDLKRELRVHFKRDARHAKVKAFTEEHAKHFLAVSEEHSELYSFYVTGFLAGPRIGELCGLQLEDDHSGLRDGKRVRLLHIERQLGQECSMLNPKPGSPKGQVRDVDVGRKLGDLFDELKAERKKRALALGWRPVPPWAFITRNGTPYSERNVLRDFTRILQLAGLEDHGYTPHSMRHHFACFHIARGKSPQWIKQQMGHSSINVTLDTYGDWFRLHDQQAADDMGAALLSSEGNK